VTKSFGDFSFKSHVRILVFEERLIIEGDNCNAKHKEDRAKIN